MTFFDTAAVYGTGHSERVLARAFAGKRAQVVIATKFGPVFDESTRRVTLSQGALAWPWARSEKMIPIPGFRTVAQVEENCRSMEWGSLPEEQFREIEQIMGREQ